MSRSHAVLAVALLGIAVLAGVVRLTQSPDGTAAVAAGAPEADGQRERVVPPDGNRADAESAAAISDELGLEPRAVVVPDCPLTVPLRFGTDHPDVTCLEAQLIDAGVLVNSTPDEHFDEATDAAVRSFQEQNDLAVDGVVGSRTASLLGLWVGPHALPPDPDTCSGSGREAVIDRYNQRAWLCEGGGVADVMPLTSALSQPDPGTYEVYAKELLGSSTIGGGYSEMTHFVAFSHGRSQGARIAFHSVPTYPNGQFVQSLDSVGTAELHGASAGCIRVLPEDAELIWSWLEIGDRVTVVT